MLRRGRSGALVPGLLRYAGVAQLVEHYLAKVDVAGSNPVSRSTTRPPTRAAVLRGDGAV
jgi:hypothetical protein